MGSYVEASRHIVIRVSGICSSRSAGPIFLVLTLQNFSKTGRHQAPFSEQQMFKVIAIPKMRANHLTGGEAFTIIGTFLTPRS